MLVARAGRGEAQVVGDAAGEQERILQHDAELAAVVHEVDLAQVVAVHAHGALARIVEAPHEPRERRLAAARHADERDAGAGRDVEVDAVQDRVAPVGERHALERDVALDAVDAACVRRARDVGLLVQDARDLLHRGGRGLHLAVQLRELLQRLEEQREQPDERDQRAERERAVLVQARAEREHRDGRDHAEQLDRREEQRGEVLRVLVGALVGAVELGELLAERVLAVVGLDHGHAGAATRRSAR